MQSVSSSLYRPFRVLYDKGLPKEDLWLNFSLAIGGFVVNGVCDIMMTLLYMVRPMPPSPGIAGCHFMLHPPLPPPLPPVRPWSQVCLLLFNMSSFASRFISFLLWPVEEEFTRSHARRAMKNVATIPEGLQVRSAKRI